MRKTRIGALVSASALASASIIGGAGAANASTESLEDLLPGGEPGVTLSIDEVTTDEDDDTATVEGLVSTDVEEATLECEVTVADAEDVREAEEAYAEDETYELEGDATDVEGLTDEEALEWSVEDVDAGPEFVAGAGVWCDDGDDNEFAAFAYDGAEGSLDLGSLDFGDSLGDLLDS